MNCIYIVTIITLIYKSTGLETNSINIQTCLPKVYKGFYGNIYFFFNIFILELLKKSIY